MITAVTHDEVREMLALLHAGGNIPAGLALRLIWTFVLICRFPSQWADVAREIAKVKLPGVADPNES